MKLNEPSRKGRRKKAPGCQADFVRYPCVAVGKFVDDSVILPSYPEKYYYHFAGYFGIPIHVSDDDVHEEVADKNSSNCDSSSETENSKKLSNEEQNEVESHHFETADYIASGYLLLTLHEAFYLSYSFGMLGVEYEDRYLDLVEMWRLYCKTDESFIARYVVYHHFRSKNWIVRCGMRLGADFVLYKDGPSFYHASYAVKICNSDKSSSSPCLSWGHFSALNRIINQVKKELLICYVEWPSSLSDEQAMRTPECISQFTVQEVLCRRWVAAEERDGDYDSSGDN